MDINITIIQFTSNISESQAPAFRGAIMDYFNRSPLFHNHTGNGFIYQYPKIQYKIIDNMVSIVGWGEGAQLLDTNLTEGQKLVIPIYDTPQEITVATKTSVLFSPDVKESKKKYTYIIKNWLPLNQKNYKQFRENDTLEEKLRILNRILTHNILSIYKGFKYWTSEEITGEICDIIRTRPVRYKGISLISFDIRITTNALLPQFCGIGKGSSKGYGTIFGKN